MSAPEPPEEVLGESESPNAEGNASLSTSGGIMEKLRILEGDGWLTDYEAKMVSPFEYAVLSLNNGQPSQHYVNLRERTCTCEDKKYNVDRAAGMCKHQLYCMVREDTASERDTALLAVVAHGSHIMATEAQRLTRAATGHEADAQADTAASSDSSGGDTVDAEDARERLQAAFDTVKDGAMKTTVADGKIWINKTPDAPDYMFDAFLREPEAVFYEPDDAPEEYFKNSILPQNVDEYVSEVLE